MQPIKPIVKSIPYHPPTHAMEALPPQLPCVFLDSSMQNSTLGRYSYLAVDPFKTMTHTELNPTHNFFAQLKNAMTAYQVENIPHLPPFQGGCAGFFSYDLARELETLPDTTRDDRHYPLAGIGFFDLVISFDHVRQKAWIISSGLPEQLEPQRTQRAQARLKQCYQMITQPSHGLPANSTHTEPSITADLTITEYKTAVNKIRQYIIDGDIFEANFTQRFQSHLDSRITPWQLYQQLRTCNPATFSAYLNLAGLHIASSSPERFLKVEQQQVETRPIKGTRPRVADPFINKKNIAELLTSRKDHAENTMIVDLMRNDLSKVCKPHSIKVPQLCCLESYAKVHHLVSVITGELQTGQQAIDLLTACFPGGSITGAPKVRAMEIIEELEPTRRGPYCGSIGYLGFNGSMDTSIVIRTLIIQNNHISFQAGGAVIFDSDPQQEYDESLTKAAALCNALQASKAVTADSDPQQKPAESLPKAATLGNAHKQTDQQTL